MRDFYALVEIVQDSNNPPDVTLYEDHQSAMGALLDLVDENACPTCNAGERAEQRMLQNYLAERRVDAQSTGTFEAGEYAAWVVRTKGGYR